MIAVVLHSNMSWWLVIGLSIGAYVFKVSGLVVTGPQVADPARALSDTHPGCVTGRTRYQRHIFAGP